VLANADGTLNILERLALALLAAATFSPLSSLEEVIASSEDLDLGSYGLENAESLTFLVQGAPEGYSRTRFDLNMENPAGRSSISRRGIAWDRTDDGVLR
jgi:hypothetical protein